MQTINIKVSDLLPIVKQNLEKHNNVYEAAVSGYWIKAESELNNKIIQIQKKEKIEPHLNVNYPTSYSDEYKKVIRMLELTSDNTVQLTANEFDAYVRNHWQWRYSFLSSNMGYINACSGAVIATGGYFGDPTQGF